MAEYEYTGPGPHEDPELGLIRPGDVREFGAEPDFGPWRLVGGALAAAGEAPPETPAPVLSDAELGALKKSADAFLAAGSIPPASSLATPPVTLREM